MLIPLALPERDAIQRLHVTGRVHTMETHRGVFLAAVQPCDCLRVATCRINAGYVLKRRLHCTIDSSFHRRMIKLTLVHTRTAWGGSRSSIRIRPPITGIGSGYCTPQITKARKHIGSRLGTDTGGRRPRKWHGSVPPPGGFGSTSTGASTTDRPRIGSLTDLHPNASLGGGSRRFALDEQNLLNDPPPEPVINRVLRPIFFEFLISIVEATSQCKHDHCKKGPDQQGDSAHNVKDDKNKRENPVNKFPPDRFKLVPQRGLVGRDEFHDPAALFHA